MSKTSGTLVFAAAVAAAMAATCGCYTDTRATSVTLDAESGTATVLEDSYRLSERLRVVKTTYDEVGGIKRATVVLESRLKRRHRLQARMVWYDSEGAEIDADGKAYRAIVLDGLDTAVFTGVAPNASAVKARLRVREMDTVE